MISQLCLKRYLFKIIVLYCPKTSLLRIIIYFLNSLQQSPPEIS